jgi:sigma-B regulation protein RsbU (phosphoserine phosphatase)
MGAIFAFQAPASASAGLVIGTVYLAPTLLAGVWFGRWGGLLAGIVGAGLFYAGQAVSDATHLASSTLLRLGVYAATGFLVGWLLEERFKLRAAVEVRDQELGELRGIREALTPSELPERPSLELASCYMAAEQGVTGDFYLAAEAPEEATVVVVGDVVGHGLEAARRAFFVRMAIASAVPFTDDPVQLLEMANRSLIERAGTSEKFVTACCAIFHPRDGSISWSLAGHQPPVWAHDGTPLEHAEPGLPLGLEPGLRCQAASTRMPIGSAVVLFTDGLREARHDERDQTELFGDERISKLLARLDDQEPHTVVETLCSAARDFSGETLSDDVCVVAVRNVGPASNGGLKAA